MVFLLKMSEICLEQPELAVIPPSGDLPGTSEAQVTQPNLIEKTKGFLGKLAIATTSFLLMHGVISPDSAAASGRHVTEGGMSPAKITQIPDHIGYGMIAKCGDPAYDAPEYKQLRTALCLTNSARETPLLLDPDLTLSAEQDISEILVCGNIDHDPCDTGNDFRGFPWYKYKRAGENIAFGHGAQSGSMQNRFPVLMRSPTHRKNIEDEGFDRVGIATILLGDERITVYRFGDYESS